MQVPDLLSFRKQGPIVQYKTPVKANRVPVELIYNSASPTFHVKCMKIIY